MSKVRINDLARELEVKSRAILDVLDHVGVTEKKTHSSSLELDEAERVRAHFQRIKAGASAAGMRGDGAPKPKIDLSRVSKPGDVLKALQQKKEETAAPPPRPVPAAAPVVAAAPARPAAASVAAPRPAAPVAAVPAPAPERPADFRRRASGPGSAKDCSSAQGRRSDCGAAASSGHRRQAACRTRCRQASRRCGSATSCSTSAA